jgi:hypothetical protein
MPWIIQPAYGIHRPTANRGAFRNGKTIKTMLPTSHPVITHIERRIDCKTENLSHLFLVVIIPESVPNIIKDEIFKMNVTRDKNSQLGGYHGIVPQRSG